MATGGVSWCGIGLISPWRRRLQRDQQPAATPRSKWMSMRRVSAGVAPRTVIRLSVITPQGLSTGAVVWQADAASAIPNASAVLNRAPCLIGLAPRVVIGFRNF